MTWLRDLLSGRAGRSSKSAGANAFRPKLEALDSRELPSVSSALTATGSLVTYIVDNSNSLLLSIDGSAPAVGISGGVRTAQAFQTPGGSFGVDIVFTNGTWEHFENPTGTPGIFAGITGPIGSSVSSDQLIGVPAGGQILDVGTAYDPKGAVRLDVLIGTGGTGLDQTGKVYEFNTLPLGTGAFVAPSAPRLTDTGLLNVRWISDYTAANGMTGLAWGTVDGGTLGTDTTAGTGLLQAYKFDVVDGLKILYQGRDQAGGGITEYSQTVLPPQPLFMPVPPRLVVDVTYDADTAFSSTFDPTRTYSLTYDSRSPVTGALSVFSRTSTIAGSVVKPGG